MDTSLFEKFPAESNEELFASVQEKIELDEQIAPEERASMVKDTSEFFNKYPDLIQISLTEKILRSICKKDLDPYYEKREEEDSDEWSSEEYVQESLLEGLTPDQVTDYVKNFIYLSHHNLPTFSLLKTKGALTQPADYLYKRLDILSTLPNSTQILEVYPYLLSDKELETKVSIFNKLPSISQYDPKLISKVCSLPAKDLDEFFKTIIGYPYVIYDEFKKLVDTPLALEAITALSHYELEFRNNPEAKLRLSSQEEHILFKSLADDIVKIEDPDEQKEIKKRIITVIFQCNTRLIYTMMRKYGLLKSDSETDYYLDGEDGLLKAIDVFDYKRGTAFSTVACLWIGQTVSRAYYERKHTYLKIPDALGQGMQHYLSLEKNLGGNLTYDELAQIAKIEGISIPSQEEIEMIHHPLRLDKPAKPDEKDSSTEGELFVTKTASPEDEVINKLLAEEIMALLSPLYQEILRLSAEGYTDGEIAEKFGWTPQNIQEKRARAKRLAKDLVNKHAAQEEIDLYLDI